MLYIVPKPIMGFLSWLRTGENTEYFTVEIQTFISLEPVIKV